jgi:hypothetical protein
MLKELCKDLNDILRYKLDKIKEKMSVKIEKPQDSRYD